MRKRKAFWHLLICLVVSTGLVLGGTAIAAEQNKAKAADKPALTKDVKDKGRKEAGKKRETIVKEAVSALEQTKKVIEALDKKKKQEALDALALVTGKLEIVLARDPGLANAPIDVRMEQYDLYATIDVIKDAIKEAQDLLDDGEVQKARAILAGLASEIDIVVTSMPLATYADGIKSVAKLVEEEKYTEAKERIYDLLGTLVVTRNIIPLPLVRAEELLKKASKLAETKDRTEKQNEELSSLLDKARYQIEMAEVLGYGEKKEYKKFYAQIKEIKKKTSDGKFGTGFFDKIEKSLKEFKEKIFSTFEQKGDKAKQCQKKE